MFDLASCADAATRGEIDHWVDQYLCGGPWANPGLRDGLRRQRRYWIGPLLVAIDRLERCCGPEPSMEYVVAPDAWHRKVAAIASSLRDRQGPYSPTEGRQPIASASSPVTGASVPPGVTAKPLPLAGDFSQPGKAEDVPPLIIEWRAGLLSIRDGNHRAAAMLQAGWTHCWIVVWCNSPAEYQAALAQHVGAGGPGTVGRR